MKNAFKCNKIKEKYLDLKMMKNDYIYLLGKNNKIFIKSILITDFIYITRRCINI